MHNGKIITKTKDGNNFYLYRQQIKVISFLSNKGNGLLDYDIGFGKTACDELVEEVRK